MGLFVVPHGISVYEAAKGNLELYEEYKYDYMLSMAIQQLHEEYMKSNPEHILEIRTYSGETPYLFFNGFCNKVSNEQLLQLKKVLDEYLENRNENNL